MRPTALVALLIASTASQAATLEVGPAAAPYATIQEALDVAVDGDIIAVAPGTYEEYLVVEVDVSILGTEGPEETVITADETVVMFSEVTASLSGFNIVAAGGRAIEARGGSVSLSDVVVSGVSEIDRNGGGLYALSTELWLSDCAFQGNDVGAANGAHLYASGSVVDIDGCTFSEGLAQKGGALFLYNSSTRIVGSDFSDNQVQFIDAVSRGGGIRVEAGDLELVDCNFDSNEASEGYGGHVSAFAASVTVDGGSFRDGLSAGYYGGAIAGFNSELSVADAIFEDNRALAGDDDSFGYGGAVVSLGEEGEGALTMERCELESNASDNLGGAVAVLSGAATIGRTAFDQNASERGGAVYLAPSGDAAIESCSFSGNEAEHAGAVYWHPEESVGSLSVVTSRFEQNASDGYGGALYAYEATGVSLIHNEFDDNRAIIGGAVMLWAVDDVTANQNSFCANHASGATNSDGGAVAVYEAGELGLSLTNNYFVENAASAWGGGLSVVDSEHADVVNNHFLGNQSDSGGGFGLRGGDAEFTNNLVAWTIAGSGLSTYGGAAAEITYNDFFENDDSHLGGTVDDRSMDGTNLNKDPLLGSFTLDGDCGNDDLEPTSASPLIDAGDPEREDTDGSRSDIGATGGDGADVGAYTDADEDGYVVTDDCDDGDDDIYPGADEVPYDGVDDDCDGEDLVDVDGDGFDGDMVGGGDCDDEDDTVYPSAEDAWYDGVDSDCSGGSDYDADGDGYASEAYGGEDCDDADGAVHPGADDAPEDGLDADCDGIDPTDDPSVGDDTGDTTGDDTGIGEDTDGVDPSDTAGIGGEEGDGKDGGCSCATQAGPTGALWALGLGLVGLRRRRSGR